MPAASVTFAGLDFDTWGAGHPPDTVGDVGTDFYVQAVNTSIGIWAKSGGSPLAAFTFDDLWSGAGTGTACDSSHNGDPTVVFDPQANRYIVADFAWTDLKDGPYYECIAVSKTGNPVTGGWWLYAVRADDASHPWLPDYPKMGIWPDGLYMTANMFDCLDAFCGGANYEEVRAYAFNRSDLESGAVLRSRVVDLNTTSYFSLLPSNLRGASPPAGRENLMVSESESLWAFEVWKFHVDYSGAGSTFTGPTNVSQTSYTVAPSTVPSSGNNIDTLLERMMMQNQYRNLAGTESLWVNHTVSTSVSGPAGIQWAQLNVTDGTVSTTPVQQQIYGNVGSDGLHRFMGSLAVDDQGNMALGYSTSKAGVNPDIRYTGRLASDPLNSLPQGEATLQAGGGSQSGSCGGTCSRWGDYSAMTIDPDGCTFWYTNMYYATSGLNWQTRIGSFAFPSCAPSSPPNAASDAATTSPDTPITLTLHGSDGQSCELAFTITASPTHGSLGSVSDADCTPGSPNTDTATVDYTPDSGYTGSDSFDFKVTDGDALDSAPATISVTINVPDETPPDTSITGEPTNPSKSTSASFTFDATEAATFECSLDGGPFVACSSPQIYSNLPKRSHLFAVRATDAATNTDLTPATFAWTNGKPPTMKISGKPPKLTNNTDPVFIFASTDPGATLQCALDGGAFADCISPRDYTGLTEGAHTFAVEAIDAANRISKPTTASWTIDVTPPDTLITAHPVDPTNSTTAKFKLGANEKNVSFQCRLDGAAFSACKSAPALKGLAPGTHTFEAKATDPAGNTDSTPAIFAWTIL